MFIVIFFNLVLYSVVYACTPDGSVETILYNVEDIIFLSVELITTPPNVHDSRINKTCENVNETKELRFDKYFNDTILKLNNDCSYYYKYSAIINNKPNNECKTILKIKKHTDNPINQKTCDVKYTVDFNPFQANTTIRYLEGEFNKTSNNTYTATRYVGQNYTVSCDDILIYTNNRRVMYKIEKSSKSSYKLKVQKFDDNAEMQCGAGSNRQIYKLRVLNDGNSIGYDTSLEKIVNDTHNNLLCESKTEKQYVSWILVDANDVVVYSDGNEYRRKKIPKSDRDKYNWSKLVCLQNNCEHKNIENGEVRNETKCQREVIKVYKKSTKPTVINTEHNTEKPVYPEKQNRNTNDNTKITEVNTLNSKGYYKTTEDTNIEGNPKTTKDTNIKDNPNTTKDTNIEDNPKNTLDNYITTEDTTTKTKTDFLETDIASSSQSGSENQSFTGPPFIGIIIGVTGIAISIFMGIYCKWKGKNRRKQDNEKNATEETIYASTDRIQYLELNLEGSANIPPPKKEEVVYSKIAGVLLDRSKIDSEDTYTS